MAINHSMVAHLRWPLAVVVIMLLVACGKADATPTPTSPTQVPTSAPGLTRSSVAATITVAQHPKWGAILTDATGRVLYLFTSDERDISTCYEGCAAAWPPLLTDGEPAGVEGADASRIGTTTRDDGSTQVTYNGWPLYHFAADEGPGGAMGQNVGGIWFVVSTFGGPIQTEAVVRVSTHPELGTILSDASGRTLYLFSVDERNRSNCLSGCATAWPPLITVGEPVAGEEISAGRLGTIIRDDGYVQVTYNGWPLYYYAPDRAPGDAGGQNSGDIWFVVSTDGGPIQNNAIVKTSTHPDLGAILVDTRGRTLYLFTVDEKDRSNCMHGCALAWPPLHTVGDPSAEEGVEAGRLGVIARDDGSSQVTYNGFPLYYFAPDEKPGDAKGHFVGDTWFVVTPSGEALTTPPPTPDTEMDHPTQVSTPTPTPAGDTKPTATTPADATSPPSEGPPEVQDVATIENYSMGEFYPSTLVVIKDVPLNLYITRLFREHVNQFHILPFLPSTNFFSPGTMGVEKFTPDESGEFVMQNVGHGHQGRFIVVDTVEDAKSFWKKAGRQEFALIHDLDKGTISPDRVVVERGVPVRVYNISLRGKAKVSIEPFYTTAEVNVESLVTTFEFTPDVSGEFVIRYEERDATGTLIVK